MDKQATICGVYGHGPTMAEAKADAMQRVQHVVNLSLEVPYLIHGVDADYVVFAHFGGWVYSRTSGRNCKVTVQSWDTRDEAIAHATYHAAQNAQVPGDAGSLVASRNILIEHSAAQYTSDVVAHWYWQTAYSMGRIDGLDDEQARDYAWKYRRLEY